MKKLLFLFLVLASSCAWAADLAFTIDTDGVSGDYSSLNAWNTAQQQDLTDAGGDTMTVTCSATTGVADTTAMSILGWTTGATTDITVIGGDFPANGQFDSSAYRMTFTDVDNAMSIRENYVTVEKLQFSISGTTGTRRGINIFQQDAGNDIIVDSCIFLGSFSGTGGGQGIIANDADLIVKICNLTVTGFISCADADFYGIFDAAATTCNIFNCTVYNCGTGIRNGDAVTNCISATNNDDFNPGSATITFCGSDDGDGTSSQDAVTGDWDNELTDANGTPADFSLVSGGNMIENGTDDPSSGLYTDDIISVARSSTWDIGAFEFVAAGGEFTHVMIIMGSASWLVLLIAFGFWNSKRKTV